MFKCRGSMMLILDYHDFLDFGFRPYICFYVVVCHHQKGEIVSFEVDLRQIKGDLRD